jgi:hypothetical protein
MRFAVNDETRSALFCVIELHENLGFPRTFDMKAGLALTFRALNAGSVFSLTDTAV